MKKNMGTVDRTARLIVGIVVIVLGVVFKSWLGIIGIIPVGTALVGNCPLYTLFGMSSCKPKE